MYKYKMFLFWSEFHVLWTKLSNVLSNIPKIKDSVWAQLYTADYAQLAKLSEKCQKNNYSRTSIIRLMESDLFRNNQILWVIKQMLL